MSETITLPRSGVALCGDAVGWQNAGGEFSSASPAIGFWRRTDPREITTAETTAGDRFHGTEQECIAWLDSRVLAIRSALMPADARERVLNVLVYQYGEAYTDDVDAVLAALNGGTDEAS